MNQKGFAYIGIAIGIVVILSIASFLVYKYLFPPKVEPIKTTSTPEFTKDISDPVPSSKPLIASSLEGKYWTIKKGKETFYSVKTSSGALDIAKWGDWVITTNKTTDFKNQLLAKNINTSEQKVIYEESATNGNLLNSFTVINNKLYFASSGYLTDGGIYQMPDMDAKPVMIFNESGAGIKKEKDGKYFFMSGFGDSCSGSLDVSLFNPEEEKIIPVIKTKYSCGKGTSSLGYVANKGYLVTDSEYREDTAGPDGWITKLSLYPLSGNPQVLIPENSMPVHTSHMRYSPDLNKIIVITEDSIYEFDLESSKLNKLMPFDSPNSYVSFADAYTACINDYSNNSKYQLDLKQNKIVDLDICNKDQYIPNEIKEVEKKFKELELPKEFTLNLE